MRLDTSEQEAIEWAQNRDISFHENLPVDLCFYCANNEGIADMAEVEHPPYDDDIYHCAVCECLLDDIND